MAYKIDVREDGTPVRWALDPDGGATPTADPDYEPAIYAAARDDREGALAWLADALADDPKVVAVERTERYRSLRADERSPMLELRLERLDEVRQVAREVRQREQASFLPGTFQLYDVDLDPGFRYVLDRGFDPKPDRDLATLDLALPEPAVADGDLRPLRIGGVPASEASGDSSRAERSDGEPAVEGGAGSNGVPAAAAAATPDTAAVVDAVERELAARDPDVLLLSTGEIVPLLAEAGVDLGRRSGFSRIAGESTFVSYGQVGHSPARYDVPGRALVNRSNSFLLSHSALPGLLYFVEEAGKPLQEIAKDSIGGVLTAIEIRAARQWDGERVVEDRDPSRGGGVLASEARKGSAEFVSDGVRASGASAGSSRAKRSDGVPAPWQKRQTEDWKSLGALHAADRGGFTFQPEAGVHEDVHELDFASLYPNIIREHRVSPDTVCCDCHDAADLPADRRVPELGYGVCPDGDAFLSEVLAQLIEDRKRWKGEIRAAAPDDDTDDREAKVEAIKWVLVSCFGYQGYRHAKFGRIEVHEAINAYAREIMLTAKERLEDAGWRVVHGIVDSVWVTAAPDREQRPIREVAGEISDEVRIEFEYEGRFDWVAFCPRKRASGAALMRYFGRWADESVSEADVLDDLGEIRASGGELPRRDDRYKLRGIEARQRSTCAFVADAQRDLLDVFDREGAPEPVCDRFERHLRRLRTGEVDATDLAIIQRVSKAAEDYEQSTRAKAALERAAAVGIPRSPGQDVEYVVVDDALSGPERVRLAFEFDGAVDAAEPDPAPDGRSSSDPEFYADRLVRACESLVAPLGWNEGRIRSYLQGDRDAALSAFGE